MERDLKQLSRGLHGINRARNFLFFSGKRNAFKDKTKAKTRKGNVPHFVYKTTCFVVLLSGLLFFFLFSFFLLFFDRPPGTAGLVTQNAYLALDVKVLRHAQQLQHLFRKLSPADNVAGEAKYTQTFFLHSSGANLNLCLTNAGVKSDT